MLYILVKTLLITKRVELINKTKFAKAALDKNFETFVMHIAALEAPLVRIIIYLL